MPFPVSNIRNLCKEKGTTLAALEKKLGFGNGVIAGWETAKNWPPYDRLYAVATELKTTVDELAGNNKNATPLSSIGANIVAAAGNINAARLTLHSLHIDDAGINAMLYGGYVWTDNALAQIAEALGCSVDALKKEKAPDHMVEDLSADELEIVSILRKMSPEQLARELAYLRQIPGDAQDK